jgi:hypothetical protein
MQTTMLTTAGKRHRQTLRAANVCTTSSARLFVTDQTSKQRYLVDTGSDLCIFPSKLLPGYRECMDYNMYAANSTTIPTYRWTFWSLNLGLRRDFTWWFMIADVQLPIIDLDLLSHYGLLVDCRNNHLLDGGHIFVNARPHRTTIGTQHENHRRRHAPRQSPGGIPGGDYPNRNPSWGVAQHHAPHWDNTRPAINLAAAWLWPRPSLTLCCGTVQPDVPRAHGHLLSNSCPRMRAAGGLVEITEPWTFAPSLTITQSHTSRTTPTAFLTAPPFPKLT